MDKKTVLNAITDFKNALELKAVHIKKIILFGSFAFDKAKEESDIDLMPQTLWRGDLPSTDKWFGFSKTKEAKRVAKKK